MAFIEWMHFHAKIMNLTVYEILTIDFICRKSLPNYLKPSSSTIKEENKQFMKSIQSILLVRIRDDIYWMELLHDKRGNLIVYDTLPLILLAWSPDDIYWWGALPR
jgi:hypothetical protein